MPMHNKRVAQLEALFAVTVWGASFIATKLALRDISPVTIVWLRFGMGVIIIGAAVVGRRQFAWPSLRELAFFTLLGGIGITFHQWLQSTGMVTSQASTTAWIVATTPVFIALLGWAFLKEKLGWIRVGGIALATVGVILVVSKGDLRSMFGGSFGSPGDWLILISALNWAVFSILSRGALSRHPAARMMFFVMTMGWFLTGVQFFSGPYPGEIAQLTWQGWAGVAFLGIFCSGLAYIAWYDALKELPATQVGVFLYLEPLVAVVVAAIMLGEAVTLASLLGGAVILLGVWQVNRPVVRVK